MQAGGHRFEPGCLHFPRSAAGGKGREANLGEKSPEGFFRISPEATVAAKRTPGNNPSQQPEARSGLIIYLLLYRGKVTRSWRRVVPERERPATFIARWAVLFFVRVNQVLVRLWTRAMEADACLWKSRCSGRCLTGKAVPRATVARAPPRRAARVQRRVLTGSSRTVPLKGRSNANPVPKRLRSSQSQLTRANARRQI